MITRVSALEFLRPTSNGRTGPALAVCEHPSGTEIDIVLKYSEGCDQKEINLASEVISACLAADLGLPVPEPFIVQMDAEFVASVPDSYSEFRGKLAKSNPIAFGSKHITGQYSAWAGGNYVTEKLLPCAAAIFAFDGITQNPDRREGNPNCLVKGDDVRVIDHELAFRHNLVLFWKAPWVIGGLRDLEQAGAHIFRPGLRGRVIDFGAIRDTWQGLSDARISDYGSAVPVEWSTATNFVETALELIKNARDNIDACILEIQRVLR